jgi:outer membrane usher protein
MRRSPAIEAALLVMAAAALRTPALAQDIPALPAATSTAGVEELQLEVWINGLGTGLVAAVSLDPDGRLWMSADELRAVGLASPHRTGKIDLTGLPGLGATYDEIGQRLLVEANVGSLLTQRFDLSPTGANGLDARQDAGAVLNYAFSADGGQVDTDDELGLDGLGLSLDARVFGKFGAFDTAVSGGYASGRGNLVRLNSTWNWYSPRHAMNVRAGDFINAGFSWTRPIRMAGLQIRRDFATRPDLITMPSPRLSASAAAPSILDLYINDTPLLSRRVGAGPIQIDGLPSSQGFSRARLVLRDEAGRQTEITAPFFTTPLLLSRGFVDYAAEIGVARRYYGVKSSDYADMPLATGSLRYGLRDGLTLESHAEVGAGVFNLGGGFASQLNGLGVAALSVAGSRDGDTSGALVSAVFDSRFAGVYISAMAMQASAGYRDLAAATSGRWHWNNGQIIGDQPPRSVRQLTLSTPVALNPFHRDSEPATLSLSLTAQEGQDGMKRSVFNGSLRQTLSRRITVYATGYISQGERHDAGVFFGVAIPLGARVSTTVGAQTQGDDTIVFAEASKAEDQAAGTTAWRMRVEQGASSEIEAQGVYRGRAFRLSGVAQRRDGATHGQAQLDGAIAWMGGPPALANRLDGAFAMVDVGAPDVPVLFQNQKIGRSDRHGRLVVRNLSPFDENKIAIDPRLLALDLEADDTEKSVVPVEGGGVLVRFGVAKTPPSALVTLRRPDGQVVPPGAEAVQAGSDERVIVGYDGQAFLTNLKPTNDLTVHLEDDATCVAHFAFTPSPKGGPGVVEAICR